MHMWEGIVAIAAIGGWVNLRGMKYRAMSARRDNSAPALEAPREAELLREVDRLHERIRVLERIATDTNSASARQTRALSDEIESLRDHQGSPLTE